MQRDSEATLTSQGEYVSAWQKLSNWIRYPNPVNNKSPTVSESIKRLLFKKNNGRVAPTL
jgi:hypothetical protein